MNPRCLYQKIFKRSYKKCYASFYCISGEPALGSPIQLSDAAMPNIKDPGLLSLPNENISELDLQILDLELRQATEKTRMGKSLGYD